MNDGISSCRLHKLRFDKLLELHKLLLALDYDIANPIKFCRNSPLLGKWREGESKVAKTLYFKISLGDALSTGINPCLASPQEPIEKILAESLIVGRDG